MINKPLRAEAVTLQLLEMSAKAGLFGTQQMPEDLIPSGVVAGSGWLVVSREALLAHLEGAPYQEILIAVWDAVQEVAPFVGSPISRLYLNISGRRWGLVWWEGCSHQTTSVQG